MAPTRREAIRTVAGVAVLAALGGARNAAHADETASPAAPGSGHLRHSVCRWCYKEMPLEELAAGAKRIGLESVELLDPPEWEVVERHGLTCAMANGATTIPNGLNRIENHATQVPGMIDRIQACARHSIPNVICFSGNRRGMPDEQGLENCAIALKQIVGEAEKRRVTVCLELLNSLVNHKDYMGDHTAWGFELVRRVGSDRFKILYDIYHMQIMEGDIISTVTSHHDYIAHFHTGGVPGRHEIDGSQELNYPAVMRAIVGTGFRGFVAQEFIPTRDPLTSLAEGVRICTV